MLLFALQVESLKWISINDVETAVNSESTAGSFVSPNFYYRGFPCNEEDKICRAKVNGTYYVGRASWKIKLNNPCPPVDEYGNAYYPYDGNPYKVFGTVECAIITTEDLNERLIFYKNDELVDKLEQGEGWKFQSLLMNCLKKAFCLIFYLAFEILYNERNASNY